MTLIKGMGKVAASWDGSIPGDGTLHIKGFGRFPAAAVAGVGSSFDVAAKGFGRFAIDGIEADITAALTGTFLTTPTEAEVVTGGQTIIITLTGGEWVASGATFNATRQAIIDGLTSAQSEAAGWNAEVRDAMAVTTVVRTNATTVTITLPATAGYSITANETVTVTVPASAVLNRSSAIVATPTIVIVAG